MKCPNCGKFIEATETIDNEYFNGKYYDTVEGTCLNCGKMYSWIEVFNYSHDEDIQEINPNDHL